MCVSKETAIQIKMKPLIIDQVVMSWIEQNKYQITPNY